MGDVMVITSGKGGVGKSTLAAGLGLSLARKGKRAVLIDMDMGLRSLDILLGLEHKVVYDLSDVAEGMCRVKQALIRCPDAEGLYLLSAAQTRGSDALTPRAMEGVMNQLRDRFDFILIDSPAGVGRGFRNAASAADGAILVGACDIIAMRDVERVAGLIERQIVKRPFVVLNRVLPRDMTDPVVGPGAYEERLRLKVLGLVPEDEHMARRAGISDIGDSDAMRALERIARRLLGEDVPIEPVKRAGLMKRLREALRREPVPAVKAREP